MRLLTPRPAPKIVLESAWQYKTPLRVRLAAPGNSCRSAKTAERGSGNPTDNPELIARKLERGAESTVEKEEPEFKVDLRIEGTAQDVILKDEERMGQIRGAVGNLRNGSRTKTSLEDLGKPKKIHQVQ